MATVTNHYNWAECGEKLDSIPDLCRGPCLTETSSVELPLLELLGQRHRSISEHHGILIATFLIATY